MKAFLDSKNALLDPKRSFNNVREPFLIRLVLSKDPNRACLKFQFGTKKYF